VDNTSCSDTSNKSEAVDAKWTEEFIKEAAVQFEQNMQALLSQSE
jgi:hypothetical protein